MSGEVKWYRVPVSDVFTDLESDVEGITSEEAELRLSRYGYNEVEIQKKKNPLYQFLKQFASPLIYILLAASIVTFFLKEYTDMAVIMGVVLANAIIGFVQERKAEHALESLAKMLVQETTVLRNGQRMVIPSRELVVGDVVLLEAGNRVPADLRLLNVKNLRIDESALTGESTAVEKQTDPIDKKNPALADRKNLSFAGTLITQGNGRGIVVGTASDTEIGRISELISKTKKLSTPLVRTINNLGKKLAVVILFFSIFTFIIGKLQGYDNLSIFLASVSLAVAAIPEGLPALITISLAIGVNTMASKNAIVRTIPAVETLGSATVICSDKTGTLTKNQMTVTEIYTPEGVFHVTGTGYTPEGEFLLENNKVDPVRYPTLIETLRTGSLCNDAYIREMGDIDGDPTEGALLVSAKKVAGYHMPRLDSIPFESELRFMATLHQNKNGKHFIYVKGSPEKIIQMCNFQLDGTDRVPIITGDFLTAAEEMASNGLRVIGMAYKEVDPSIEQIEITDINELVFLGLQGMIDPPREEVKEAIHICKGAGIRVIMITGDHILTGYSIAQQLSIPSDGALSGSDIEKMNDGQLKDVLKTVSVFARTSPEDKSRIVKLLKEEGEVVAVTGDGINDAPALKNADIGIAMGRSGTEVAKEAADMVLADDNFASIVRAVEEGRDVYSKIQKVILWTLPTNAAEGLAVMAAVILGLTHLPLLPLHILWINTITAICLGIPIALEPREKNLIKRHPRPRDEPLLLPIIKQRILMVSLLMVIATFLLFFFEVGGNGRSVSTSQTMALNTIVFFEIFYLFNSKSIYDNVFGQLNSNKVMLGGIAVVVALQLFITYNPIMNNILRTAPLELLDWCLIVIVSSSVFFMVELEKYLRKRKVPSEN